jgi:hypothetical protein
LSALVGRPGIAPSPAEQEEIRGYRDRAMGELRRALDAGYPRVLLPGDHDLDSLRDRPDFRALLLEWPSRPTRSPVERMPEAEAQRASV